MLNLNTCSIEEMEARQADILTEMNNENADLNALEKEAGEIRDALSARRSAAARRANIRAAVAQGAGSVMEERTAEPKPRTLDEIRNSREYINAYANYIKTGNPGECRALLTENASSGGQLPVPVLVDQIVRTAWERDEIMRRVRRTFFRGNLKVTFERSGDVAYEHAEGTTAPTEESLTLGIVTMIPKNIKKWIHISDEVVAMGGETLLRYVYDELTYQIVRKLAALIIADIAGASTSHSGSAIGIPKVTVAPGVNTIATAAANLSDEAVNPVVIMNRLSEVNFRAAYASGNFAVDPFEGLPRVYTSALPAYDTASDNAVYAIVGDLEGAQVNYPEGDNVVIKYDDLTDAEADMVKIVGRQYAAHAVTGPGRFCNIAKPAAATT